MCNGQKPSVVRGVRASDIDHLFPKSAYPFLAIHPDNLISTCLECNTKAQRDYDPQNDHTAESLLDTFHPYYSPAIDQIELHVHCNKGMGIRVYIQERNGVRSKRVENLVRVFDLETRWADWLEQFISQRGQVIKSRSLKSKAEIREFLQEDLEH